jgi:putative zinc finger protein
MRCRTVRSHLSAYRDGELPAETTREVSLHIGSCDDCGRRLREYEAALGELQALPRLACEESIAARIHTHLEVEMRGPGLTLLFRPAWSARPLFLPSLIPAVMVLLVVMGTVFSLEREADRLPPVYVRNTGQQWNGPVPASGTEANPLFPSATVSLPRTRQGDPLLPQLLAGMGQRSFFVEMVVGRDGRVSAVTLIDGDSFEAAPILDLLRHQRFEPSRVQGRPVAVSFYRLISGTVVRAPTT